MHNQRAFDPSKRGFHAIYKPGQTNYCPGCGRSHWHIGNTTAECAFCTTALPYTSETRTGTPAAFRRGSQQQAARGRFVINGRI